tara:strand:+ start:39 stop:239 length:201 start_codon:yes stop_codon:yes gene_type:complete
LIGVESEKGDDPPRWIISSVSLYYALPTIPAGWLLPDFTPLTVTGSLGQSPGNSAGQAFREGGCPF